MEKKKMAAGDAVGVVAAQSLGEPGTQMSITADEQVIIKIDSEIKIVRIGEFVDSVMGDSGSKEPGDSEVFDFPEGNILALSLDQNEKLRWKRIISCSRHKNSKKLIKIKTASGRKITATDYHSFVIRMDNKIVPIAGKELKAGDRLPAIKFLPENCNHSLEIGEFLPAGMQERAIKRDGLVYSQRGLVPLPQEIPLDGSFGWFIGAYLSEGCSTGSEVCISNMDDDFISNARDFAEKFGLRYREFTHHRGFAWSRDFKIRSTLFSQFILNICKTGSRRKAVPDFAYSAGEEFVSSLLRGYFDGDGNVSVSRKMIRAFSNSEELIDGIKLLLTRFGIFAHKKRNKKQYWLLIPYKYAPLFLEKIGSDIRSKKEKLKRLAALAKKFWESRSQDYTDMIAGFGTILYDIAKRLNYRTRYVNNFTKRQKIGRTALYRYTNLFQKLAKKKNVDIEKELQVLRRMFNSDVLWDEIVSMEYVNPSGKYVYDFSVDGLETFTTFDGIVTHNTMRTFHYAGVAERVPTGLPRLIELVDARREPKNPLMHIYLKGEDAKREDRAIRIAEEIESTTLRQVANIEEDFIEKKIRVIVSEEETKARGIAFGEVKKAVKKGAGTSPVQSEKNVITVQPKTKLLRSIRRFANKMQGIHIKGIEKITRAIVLKGKGGYFIRTSGSNLPAVLKHDKLDGARAYTNDVKEIERVLGVEAARNALMGEIRSVLDMQNLKVDIRHVMLLADAMTMDGAIKSVGRHGLSGEKAGVLARAAFEETIKHLIAASLEGEVDKLVGITENIIVGQTVPVGTGNVRLKMKLG